jgi:hypothetical protein
MKAPADRSFVAPLVVGALAVACCAVVGLLALGAGTGFLALARFWPLTTIGASILVFGLAWLIGVRSSPKKLGSKLVTIVKAADRGLTMVGSQCCGARSAKPRARATDQEAERHSVDSPSSVSPSSEPPVERTHEEAP